MIVAGFNALSTDAVAAAVMGFDARAPHYTAPFETRENHFLIAEQAGLGTADVNRIEVRGLRIADVRTPFRARSASWEPQPALGGSGRPDRVRTRGGAPDRLPKRSKTLGPRDIS